MSEVILSSEYGRLLLENRPLIDVRAPIEFTKGAFGHSINLPLMQDGEREKVGTCYKKRGQEAAIALGHELVKGKVKQQRIDAWLAQLSQHPDSYIVFVAVCAQSYHSNGLKNQAWTSLILKGVTKPYVVF